MVKNMKLIALFLQPVSKLEQTMLEEQVIKSMEKMGYPFLKNGLMGYPLFMGCTPEDFQMPSFLDLLNLALRRLILTLLMSKVFT